ncbi:MAG TPA: energy transducer TonB [Terriglobales bacterium]|jgi:TonB family protein|nr:energy transducer TonB [Terriglobales bacterium]
MKGLAYSVSVVMLLLGYAHVNCWAQAENDVDAIKRTVVPVKLSIPSYPRLAQQARIAGDVSLKLSVGSDGHVESVDVVDGHAMLRQVAVESARKSVFECGQCNGRSASYSLSYRFQISPRDASAVCSGQLDPTDPPADVDLEAHRITVVAWEMWICDPAVKKVRSGKCLYLWKCGEHVEK